MNTDVAERKSLPKHEGKEVLTYSALAKLRNCGRAFDLRYQHWLTSENRPENFIRGSLVHEALETYYLQVRDGVDEAVTRDDMMGIIDNRCDGHYLGDERVHDRWHHALAITQAYLDRWAKPSGDDVLGQVMDHEFEVLDIEKEFVVPIVNPATGRKSNTFCMAGAVDGVVRLKSDGRLYVLERKTAASIDEGYLAKLWADFQSMLYAKYLEGVYGEPFAGVIYDVMRKSRVGQKLGENELQFEARIDAEGQKTDDRLTDKGPKLAEKQGAFDERVAKLKTEASRAKNLVLGPKPGETWGEFMKKVNEAVIKRREAVREKGPKLSESDEDFHDRLMEIYGQPDAQHREIILFDADRLAVIEEEVWDLTKQIQAARLRGRFGMNTSNCYSFGRPCDFVQVCRAGRLDVITMGGLAEREPHIELGCVGTNAPTPTGWPTEAQADEECPF